MTHVPTVSITNLASTLFLIDKTNTWNELPAELKKLR
jgi:hypothetical protein